MAASVGTAGVGIKMLMRKDTGVIQIIGMLPGGPAKLSGMVQENDSLLKVRILRKHIV
jgi:C-terminal processing protease CtpA/Prc